MEEDALPIEVDELRRGVIRIRVWHWPHACHDFDLLNMTYAYGEQGSLPSEDPGDWHTWRRARLRVLDGRVERWISSEEWDRRRESLEDWVTRSRNAYATAPRLAQYADPNEASNALAKHELTSPGWRPVSPAFNDAVIAYIQRCGIDVPSPTD